MVLMGAGTMGRVSTDIRPLYIKQLKAYTLEIPVLCLLCVTSAFFYTVLFRRYNK
jgi:hypothetical protein